MEPNPMRDFVITDDAAASVTVPIVATDDLTIVTDMADRLTMPPNVATANDLTCKTDCAASPTTPDDAADD